MAKTLAFDSLLFEHRDVPLRLSRIMPHELSTWVTFEQTHHKHPWSAANIEGSMAQHDCIGLWCANQFIGAAVISLAAKEAELLLFVLHDSWRGKGVAAAFLRQVLSMLRGQAERMYLEVRQSNQPAICLYEACGFNEVGRRPRYYPDGDRGREDALIYAIELLNEE